MHIVVKLCARTSHDSSASTAVCSVHKFVSSLSGDTTKMETRKMRRRLKRPNHEDIITSSQVEEETTTLTFPGQKSPSQRLTIHAK